MSSKIFTLGDKEFEFKPRGVRPATAWRQNFVDPLIDALMTLKTADFSLDTQLVDDDNKPTNAIGDLIFQFEPLIRQLTETPEQIVDAILYWLGNDYKDEYDYILDEVPIDQLIDPFIHIVTTWIFPFGKLGELSSLSALSSNGSSSPKANGAGPRKKRATKAKSS